MANEATLPLREDHKKVLKRLAELDRLLGALEEPATAAPLKELGSFFKTEFWVHFSKEEEALFPEMERHIPRQGGPLGVMLSEHDQLRKINQGFQQGMDRFPGHGARELVLKHGREFVDILRGHIEKEENVLFMFAERLLSPEEVHRAAAKYPTLEATASR